MHKFQKTHFCLAFLLKVLLCVAFNCIYPSYKRIYVSLQSLDIGIALLWAAIDDLYGKEPISSWLFLYPASSRAISTADQGARG